MLPLSRNTSVVQVHADLDGNVPRFPPERCDGPSIARAAQRIAPPRVIVRDNMRWDCKPGAWGIVADSSVITAESPSGGVILYEDDANALTPEIYSAGINELRGTRAAMADAACFGGSPNAALHLQPTGAITVLMALNPSASANCCTMRSYFRMRAESASLFLVCCCRARQVGGRDEALVDAEAADVGVLGPSPADGVLGRAEAADVLGAFAGITRAELP